MLVAPDPYRPDKKFVPGLLRDEPLLNRERWLVEVVLVLTAATLTIILYNCPRATFAILNLYVLPVTLAGFFLGRYRAANTALFCVLAAIVAVWQRADFADWIMVGMWGGVLGLQALVIGTLCDDHHREVVRLQEMHRTDTLSDALTGVANRRAFDYELNRRLTEWNRQRCPVSLMLIDIDHFKHLNDSYGHQAGDVVLAKVAKRIADDCRETDLVARYGGEEFAVVMPNTPAAEAMKVSERVRCGIEASRYEVGGVSIKVTISIGLAQIGRGEDRGRLVQRTDMALYSSKQAGRNCSHFHDGHECEAFGAIATRSCTQQSSTSQSLVGTTSQEYTESITGLPARRVFVDELRRRLAESERYSIDLSLMLIQMDDLLDKKLGDDDRQAVLAAVAEHIRFVVRDSDLVAYFDADQFAVLLPSTCVINARTPAARLCQRVARARSELGSSVPNQITVSVGLTGYRNDDTVATFLQRAEEALWLAVRDGGNHVAQSISEGVVEPVLVDVDTAYVT